MGPRATTALIAADDVAVARFLDGRLDFLGIPRMLEAAVARFGTAGGPDPDLDEVLALDAEVRANSRRRAQRSTGLMDGVVYGLTAFALFILILGGLVLVHELGHYLTAKAFKVRVLEFGFGFPPRAKVLRSRGETLFTLNWLPIGGFVRMEGEDGDAAEDPRSFAAAVAARQAGHPDRGRGPEHRAGVRDLLRHRAPRQPDLWAQDRRGGAELAGRRGRAQAR